MFIEVTKNERDFIVDNALNGLWNHSMERLNERHLGTIEIKNIKECIDLSKGLMDKLNRFPSSFDTIKEEVHYLLTGTETPKFLTEREKVMIDKFTAILEAERNNK